MTKEYDLIIIRNGATSFVTTIKATKLSEGIVSIRIKIILK
jgi:hypothetical protein